MLISRTAQRSVEFGFKWVLAEAANARPHALFQGIEPVVEKKMLAFRGDETGPRAIRCHGVISVGALTPVLVCFHKLEITPPSNFHRSCDGALYLRDMLNKGTNLSIRWGCMTRPTATPLKLKFYASNQ
jgi:hypothetical protein